ncbi:MAG: CHAP domain-containing protein, partial [Oscillospiraceae bacterium]|nr:CHAP domain-containing protein [Oscillospiraceae bacterium]
MKKFRSRFLSIALAFSLLAAVPSVSQLTASATSRTQSEAVDWAYAQIGKWLDWDGWYGAQCVDLISYYYDYLGVPHPPGNAIDFAWNTLPSGWQRLWNTASFVPQPGDIVVWDDGGYGHIAIVVSNNGNSTSSFQSVDQNWVGGGPNGSAGALVNHNYSNVYCFIRPNFSVSSAPPPVVNHNPIGAIDSMYTTGDGGIYMEGWAYDPDFPANSIEIHVYATGAGSSAFTA